MMSTTSFARLVRWFTAVAAIVTGAMAFAASDVTTPRAIPYMTSNVGSGLTQPTAVAIDDNGNIYVGENALTTNGSALVKKIDGQSGQVTVFAGGAAKASTGNSPCANPDKSLPGGGDVVGDGCPATQAFFGGSNGGVRGLAVWNNYLYIEDLGGYYIHRVNLATNIMEWVGGGSTSATWSGDGPLTTSTPLFKPPTGFAIDPLNGNIYFGAGGTNAATIRMISKDSATCQNATNGPFTAPCIITVVNYTGQTTAPTNACVDPAATLTAKSATVSFPQGLAFDADRNLYIAENKCSAIRKLSKNPNTNIVDQNSTFSTLVGNNATSGTAPSWYDASGAPAYIGPIRGVASASGNDLYISTTSAVYLYDSTTRWVHRIFSDAAGAKDSNQNFVCQTNMTSPYIGCPAPWATRADSSGVGAMAVDKTGNLYVTDYGSNTVVKVSIGTDFIGTAPNRVTTEANPATQYVLLHGGAVTDAATYAPFSSVLTTDTVPKPGCTPYTATGDNGTDCVVAVTYKPTANGIETGTLHVIAAVAAELALQGLGDGPISPTLTLSADRTICATGSTCTVVVTATVKPGSNPPSTSLAVTGNMTACTGGSATDVFQSSGENTFTYSCTVPTADVADVTLGPVAAADAESRTSGNKTILVSVIVPAVAQAQSVKVTYNTATAVTLSATGSGALSYTIVTSPEHGTLSGTAPAVTYTPATGYVGPDSFTFTASNGIESAPATVSINVLPAAPVATAQSVSVDFETAKQITLAATGTGTLTYAVVAQPTNGTLSGTAPNLTYTPNSSYVGPDSFTFKATDENSQDSAPATVSITVIPNVPVASDQAVRVNYNAATPITLVAVGTGTLTYTVVTPPANGTLSGTGPNLTYTPNANYVGADSFTFKAANAVDSNLATVSITVLPAAPVAAAQSVTVPYGATPSITLAATGTGPLTYTLVTQPAHGTLSGTAPTLTYTPAADYAGHDSFTFKVTDAANQESAAATVSLTVLPSQPVAADQSVTVLFNTAKPITLASTGSGTLAFTIVTPPAHGTLRGTAPNVTYTPNSNYAGVDSFTFKTNNGLESNVATVSVNVWPAAPAATAQSVTVSYNTAKSVTLAATGTGTLGFTVLTQPAHGTLTGTAPNLTYTPTTSYGGTDSFTFKVVDPLGQESAAATVSITVNGDFTWSTASGGSSNASVAAGGTATFNLQVSGWTGATGQITFTCGGTLPAGSFCVLSPTVATMNGATPIPVTLWVKTAGTATGAAGPVMSGSNNGPWGLAFTFAAVSGTLLLLARQKKVQWRTAGACAALLLAMGLSACGGGKSQSAQTQAGSYTVTVTATSGSITKAMSVTLEVK